jgi:protein-disulfide isomerase
MRKCFLLIVSGLLIGAGTAQCQTVASDSAAIAYVNGVAIQESDLSAAKAQLIPLRKQEYEIKRSVLEAVIERKLLEAEAAKVGTTVQELLDREVRSRVPEPLDREIEAFYLAQPDRQQHPYSEAKPAMRAALLQARMAQARQEYIGKLREQARITILLDVPRVHVDYDASRMKGSPDSPIHIVEFSDFQCPYCRAEETTVKEVLAKYAGRVLFSYRDFPLSNIHPEAQLAAEASRCAAEQGKYWEYHDRLFASRDLKPENLKEQAKALGLDSKGFNVCLDGRKGKADVDRDLQEGRMGGFDGTPFFFINGIELFGAQPASEFEKIIEEELGRSRSSAEVQDRNQRNGKD